MGQASSTEKEKEVKQFRKESKKRAKELGFISNKYAPRDPLNKRHEESKDPRSNKQAKEASTFSSAQNTLDENFTTLVVDILEAHDIGAYEVGSWNDDDFNFIAVQIDRDHCRHQDTVTFVETDGHKRCKWNDKFAIAMFDLNPTSAQKLLTQEHSTYKEKDNSRPRGKKMVTKKKYWTLEVRIACGSSKGQHMDASTAFQEAKIKTSFGVRMNKNKDSILKDAFWVSLQGGASMRVRVELISSKKAPLVENFLPYTQWPPMILRSGKSRLQLMMEEEEYSETEFRGVLGDSLISFSPSTLPRILNVFADDYNRDFLLGFGIALGAPLIDRTQTLQVSKTEATVNNYSGSDAIHISESYIKMFNKYPVYPYEEHYFGSLGEVDSLESLEKAAYETIRNLMLNRAENILNWKRENGELRINILWSGGIDTTAMVAAFATKLDEMKEKGLHSEAAEFLACITIFYCQRSIEEYPSFYKNIIHPRFKRSIIPKHVRDVLPLYCHSNSIFVTGDPADMMFGTYVMGTCLLDPHNRKYPNPIYMKLSHPWTLFADFMVHRKLLDEAAKPYWIAWIKPFVDKSPIKVETIYDFLWWCSYGLKYQHDLNRIFYNGEEGVIPALYINSIVNFYDTATFSQWSYKFHHKKMLDKTVWASYKWPLKKFILNFTQKVDPSHLSLHRSYYKAKLKVQSVTNTFGFEHGIDSNYNRISWGKYSISKKHMEKKFPNQMLKRHFVNYKTHQLSRDKVALTKTQHEMRQEGQETDYVYDDNSWIYWMYFWPTYPYYHPMYFTPTTQSSGPLVVNGSDYGGWETGGGGGGTSGGGDSYE